jgi:hypothetical protein
LVTTGLSSSTEDYPLFLHSVCGYVLRRAQKIPRNPTSGAFSAAVTHLRKSSTLDNTL